MKSWALKNGSEFGGSVMQQENGEYKGLYVLVFTSYAAASSGASHLRVIRD